MVPQIYPGIEMKQGLIKGFLPRFASFLLVLQVLASYGCATMQQSLEAPEISLAGLSLIEASLSKQRYDLRLHVRNPNSISLPVRGMSYSVKLAGESFAQGESLQAFTVPASGEANIDLSVTTDLLRTLSGLQRMIGQGEQKLAYELGGTLQLNLPFVKALPFSAAGEVDLTSHLRY